MKSFKIKYIPILILLILVAIGCGYFSGKIKEQEVHEGMVISVSLSSGVENIPFKMTVQGDSQLEETRELITALPRINSLSQVFEASDALSVLKLTFSQHDKVSIYGISVVSGERIISFPAETIHEAFQVTNCKSEFKNNALNLERTNDGEYGITMKSPVKFEKEEFLLSWGFIAFVLVLITGWIAFVRLDYNGKRWIKVVLFAGSVSYAVSWVMFLLQEEVKNNEVNITAALATGDKGPFELYYSANGIYEGTRLISRELIQREGDINFELPSGVFAHYRCDLPKNNNVTIKELRIDSWLFTKVLKGQEIIDHFCLVNDADFHITESNELVFTTGEIDPHILFNNSGLQSRLRSDQIKKADYPHWGAIVLFSIILVLFSFPGDKKSKSFALIFVLVLILPGFTFFFKQDKVRLESEKRLASQFPEGTKGFAELSEGLTDYFDDQFGGRTGLISSWNVLKVLTFNQASHSSPVVIGSDGWMFYKAEGVQETYENKHPISEDTLKIMCDVLEERRAWLEMQGIDYYVVFPPIKHGIYEEFLPPRIRKKNEFSKLDQIIEYVSEHSDVTIVDLRESLLEAKRKESWPIYYRRDSHWNLLGGLYGYQELMKRIRQDYPDLEKPMQKDDFFWTESEKTEGDLAFLLSLNEFYPRFELIPIPKFGYNAENVVSKHYPTYISIHEPITYEANDSTLPKLVMNRDSYTNYLIPYLSEHFSRSVYLWTPKFNAEVIREEQPDIVITEMLERFWSDLMLENPAIMKEDLKKQ